VDTWAYLDEFRTEAGEHLRALDDQLLRLERDPADPAPVRAMFLSAHTIKGAAAMLDLSDVRGLAHAMEDALARLRDAGQSLDAATADLLFRATDVLRDLVARATPDAPSEDPRIAQLMGALRAGDRSRGTGDGADEEQLASPTAGPPRTSIPQSPSPVRPRALLVEDSPTVRMLESMLLADAGYTVEAVADGAEALARALREPYQLVVTGIETRGLRGLDLAAALRRAPGGATRPIIVMSSDENSANRERAAAVGVQAYIRKGAFGERRLLDAARQLLPGRGA
jgi:CheY-like chemotaxis protein/HPt (histidine-containing phosphotransfer) domain-containing protein